MVSVRRYAGKRVAIDVTHFAERKWCIEMGRMGCFDTTLWCDVRFAGWQNTNFGRVQMVPAYRTP